MNVLVAGFFKGLVYPNSVPLCLICDTMEFIRRDRFLIRDGLRKGEFHKSFAELTSIVGL